jgi:hypothetical protein
MDKKTRDGSIADADRCGIDAFIEQVWSEDGLAARTLEAYRRDLEALARWLSTRGRGLHDAQRADISAYHGVCGGAVRSMARRQSAFRRYYAALVRNEPGFVDPTLLIDRPKLPRSLPKALAEREIENLLAAPDVTTTLGLRDRAMLELMYASVCAYPNWSTCRWLRSTRARVCCASPARATRTAWCRSARSRCSGSARTWHPRARSSPMPGNRPHCSSASAARR